MFSYWVYILICQIYFQQSIINKQPSILLRVMFIRILYILASLGSDLKEQHKETSYIKDVEIVYWVAPCLILLKLMMKAYYLLS